MFTSRRLGFIWVISFIALTAVKAKSKYYDGEIRPYEFGYRIEGNQHRHEKKDENGIINGEFGFITGDGVYHSSVYATDEDGNFKLISLKSSFKIVKSTTTTAVPAPSVAVTTAPPVISVTNSPIARSPKSLRTCSNCKVIEREVYDKPSPTAPDVISVTNKGVEVPSKLLKSGLHNEIVGPEAVRITTRKNAVEVDKTIEEDIPKIYVKSKAGSVSAISPLNIALGISTAGIKASEQIKLKHKEREDLVKIQTPLNIALGISNAAIKASEEIRLQHKQREEQDKLKTTTNSEKPINHVSLFSIPLSISNDNFHTSEDIKINQQNNDNHNSPKPRNEISSQSISSNDFHTSKDIKINQKNNENHNSPKPLNKISPQTESISEHSNGINNIPPNIQTKSHTNLPVSTEDTNQRTGKSLQPSKTKLSSKKAVKEFIGDVLYRFNYTAGYHGHNEEGDSVGNKHGSYFIIGRDNIRRGVIYVANENGFVPVVKYEKVSPAEAPHEDTEKSAGLRGYEFEWFHKGKSKISDSSTK